MQRGIGKPLVARQEDAKSVSDFKEVSAQMGARRQRLTYHRRSPRVQILFGPHVCIHLMMLKDISKMNWIDMLIEDGFDIKGLMCHCC